MGGAGTLIQNMGTRRNSAARRAEAFEANGASAAVPGRVAPEVSPSLSEVFKPDEAQPVLQEAEKPLPGAVPVMETSPSEGKKAQAVAAANRRKVVKMQAAAPTVEQTVQEEVIPEDPGETLDDLRALMEEEYRNVRQMDAEEREDLRPTREVQSGGSAGEPFFSPDGVSTEIPAQQIPESTLFNNRDFPVQNDGAQETEKLPDDQRALRAIEKGDLLPSVRPVTSGGSRSKLPFSANYDKRLFDLSQNHQSAERGNPSGNRDFSVQKIVPAFQSDIKKNLLRAQEVLYLRAGLSGYPRPATDQHRSSSDTGLSMLGTQTISQNPGSGNRDFSVQNDLSQGGGLRKKPRYFEVSAEVRQREAADNARSGAEAIGRVLDPNSGVGIVHAAMHDSRLGMGRAGDIDVVRGEAGDPHRKWAGGYGLAHIIAKHGGDIVPKIADIIAHGELDVIKPKKTGSITRATYSTEDGIVALRHYNDGRTEFFVVTGYEKTKKSNNHSSKIQEQAGQLAEMPPSSLHGRSTEQTISQNPGSGNRDFSGSPGREAEFVQSASEVQERGDFGPVWRGYRGEAAIEKLLKERQGEVVGAMSDPRLGVNSSIDFVWGEAGDPRKKIKGFGLAHIEAKHGIEAIELVPAIIRQGYFKIEGPFAIYEARDGRVVLKQEWQDKPKNWVLTSYLPNTEKDPRPARQSGIGRHGGEPLYSPREGLSNARISQSSNESNRDFSVRSAWGESSWDLVRPHAETRSGVESSGGYNTVSDGKDYYVDGRNGRRREITPDRYTERYTKSRVKRIGEAMRVLENASETPIRRGASAPKGVLGYFDGKKNAIHIKAYNDIRVATHEIGHAYDQHMRLRDGIADMVDGSVGDGETRRRGQAIYGELCELGKGTSPAGVVQAFERNDGTGEWVKARDYLMKEGIAEAFALNAVNRRLFEKSYPTYSAFFNERLDANPQYKASIEEAWNAIAAYEAQPQFASWAASTTPL